VSPEPGFTEDMEDIGEVMTNYDHSIDQEVAKKLQQSSSVKARYSAWGFCGYVIWNGKKWLCDVMRHHQNVEVMEVDTLEELMEKASEKYGNA